MFFFSCQEKLGGKGSKINRDIGERTEATVGSFQERFKTMLHCFVVPKHGRLLSGWEGIV